MRILSTFALIAALGAGSVKAQASFVTFTVANNFCIKARLGMEPIAAYQKALDGVSNREFYDADYELPNWNNLVSNEMRRLCSSEYSKLVKALSAKAKWDASPAGAKERQAEAEAKAAGQARLRLKYGEASPRPRDWCNTCLSTIATRQVSPAASCSNPPDWRPHRRRLAG
jgi:hypothetical protein